MSKMYIIIGDPIPLMRARHVHRRVYDGQSREKLVSGIELQRQHQGPLLHGPLHLDITFYFDIPYSRRKKTFPGHLHYIRPDLSNLLKYIEDVCNKIIIEDDAQIASIACKKLYDKPARTEFKFEKL